MTVERIDLETFRARAREGAAAGARVLRAVPGDPAPAEDGSRRIRFIFSDETIDRAGDVIRASGWDLVPYAANNVALWAHDPSLPENVIGRGENVAVEGGRLMGDIVFAEAELNPLADMVYRLYRGRFLHAVSVGFEPIEFALSADEARPGGLDFIRHQLLEISAVPIPCNGNALAVARGQGIDTRPLIGWAERVLDGAGRPDLPRDALQSVRRAAGAPEIHPIRNPAPEFRMAVPEGGRAPLILRSKVSLAPEQIARLQAEWHEAMKSGKPVFIDPNLEVIRPGGPNPVLRAKVARSLARKSLWDVGTLACLLNELGWLHDSTVWDAEIEGDGSQVPAMLGEALRQLGDTLIAMTQEEVAELLREANGPDAEAAGTTEPAPDAADPVTAARAPAIRKLRAAWTRQKAAGQPGAAAPPPLTSKSTAAAKRLRMQVDALA